MIAGHGGVPADATAVMVNTEVFAPTAAGYVRVTPATLDATVATQEYAKGQAISNLVAVKLASGNIQVKVSAGTARILMDIAGYYRTASGALFTPLPTARVFDGTATTTARQVHIAGHGGVPADATAVLVNTEVFAPTAPGYVRVTPAGLDATVATQEFTRSQAISNLVAVKLINGNLQVKVSAGTARILMDIAGYYRPTTGAAFIPLPTARIFDGTATTTPVPVQLVGISGVPSDAIAVMVNTEVFAPTAAGYVRVTPAGLDPGVATQEFTRGQAISNLVAVQLVNGKLQVKVSAGTARILIDVTGYYVTAALGPDPLYTYTSILGPQVQLIPWVGRNVAVLVPPSDNLSAPVMTRLVAGLDGIWDYYVRMTGRTPSQWPPTTYEGRDTIADIPPACGAACSYVGFTGTEIDPIYFDLLYNGVRDRSEFDQVMPYEFGRNFSFWDDQEGHDGAFSDSLVTGFACLMRFESIAGASLAGGNTNPLYPTFQAQVAALIDQYEANPSFTFADTLAVGKAPGTTVYGGADFFASIMMRLIARHGGQRFLKLFLADLGTEAPASTLPETVERIVNAASVAACVDLGPVFYTRWGFPRLDGSVTARPAASTVTEPAGACPAGS